MAKSNFQPFFILTFTYPNYCTIFSLMVHHREAVVVLCKRGYVMAWGHARELDRTQTHGGGWGFCHWGQTQTASKMGTLIRCYYHHVLNFESCGFMYIPGLIFTSSAFLILRLFGSFLNGRSLIFLCVIGSGLVHVKGANLFSQSFLIYDTR